MHDHVPMWLGLPLLLGVGAFLFFAFRGSSKIKPDPENKPENPHIMGGGY